MIIPALVILKNDYKKLNLFTLSIMITYSCGLALFGRIAIEGIPLFGLGIAFNVALCTSVMLLTRNWILAVVVFANSIDALRVLGLAIPDYPPIYFSQIVLATFGGLVASKQGAISILSMAKRAYDNIQRDYDMLDISQNLEKVAEADKSEVSQYLSKCLVRLKSMVPCNKSSILLLLPNEPAVTMATSLGSDKVSIFDDGLIKGPIFSRTLLVGEPLWFRSIEELISEGFSGLAPKQELRDAKFLVSVPLKHLGKTIGVLALTGFDDRDLEGRGRDTNVAEYRQRIELVVSHLEASLGSRISTDMGKQYENMKSIKRDVNQASFNKTSEHDFLQEICDVLHNATGRQISLYKKDENKGILRYCSHLLAEERWREVPLNIDPNTKNRVGPAVVSFIENKSSYVRDMREVYDKLHPRTVELIEVSNIDEVISVPMGSGDDHFVWNLYGKRGITTPDSYLLNLVEELRETISVGLDFVRQKEATAALDRVNVRLIEDDDVRGQILTYSKSGRLPTTIGSEKDCLLVLVDIIGSSNMPDNALRKAHLYGEFYDQVNMSARKYLHGAIRKASGDGVILTADLKTDLITNLRNFFKDADQAGLEIGCKGVRMIVHYGNIFVGMVGTKTFAQIDTVGTEIDRLCKLEAVLKEGKGSGKSKAVILISEAAQDLLALSNIKVGIFGSDKNLGNYLVYHTIDDLVIDADSWKAS